MEDEPGSIPGQSANGNRWKMSQTKPVDLSHIPNIDLDFVEVKSCNGEDSLDAASRCVPPDGSTLDMNLFGLMMRNQMIVQSVVSYTPRSTKVKKECLAPPVEASQWSNRTREFVGDVYDAMNGTTTEERETFRKALASSTPGSKNDAGA